MMSDVLAIPCPACRAPAGQECKNYKGQGKQTCQARLEPPKKEPAPTPRQPDLFSNLEEGVTDEQ